MLNNLISQAAEMDDHGIPNDFLQNIDPIALIVFIPIMDLIVYPTLRKLGIHFRPITRIFVGFLFGAAAMGFTAGIQVLFRFRRKWLISSIWSIHHHPATISPPAQIPPL